MRLLSCAVSLICAAVLAGGAGRLHAQSRAEEPTRPIALDLQKLAIVRAADSRDLSGLLMQSGRGTELDVRILRGLGSVQTDDGFRAIHDAFSDISLEVREMAAWALGQTLRESREKSAYQQPLLDLLATEKVPNIRGALLDAIGRFGDGRALEAFGELVPDDTVEARGWAMGVARFAIRGIRLPATTEAVAALVPRLSHPASGINPAVYALMRIADSALLAPHARVLLDASTSANPDVRMHAVAALGKLRTTAALDRALALASDPDWRVRVNAIRALGGSMPPAPVAKRVLASVLEQLQHPSWHVRIATLQMLQNARYSHTKLSLALKKMVDTATTRSVRAEAIRTLGMAAPDLAASLLETWRSRAVPEPAMLEAAGLLATARGTVDPALRSWVAECMTRPEPGIAPAAVSAWHTFWRVERKSGAASRGNARDLSYEQRLHETMMAHSDGETFRAAAVQSVIDALRDTLFAHPGQAHVFIEALQRLQRRTDPETLVALIDGIGSSGDPGMLEALRPLLGHEIPVVRKAAERVMRDGGIPRLPAVNETAAPAELDEPGLLALRSNPVAEIRTTRGTVRVELFADEAVVTVDAFMRLAKRGFFTGLPFHRVVPNFVIQGGDPSGDGTGGPGFTLRSEFSPRSFERGMVGMASAGKDTEGSQFFIMHSHHPHLDGRYTLFGRVLEGMDVVDRIEIDDRIETVDIR